MIKPPPIYLLFNQYNCIEYRLFLTTHEWIVFNPDGIMVSIVINNTGLAKLMKERSVAILE